MRRSILVAVAILAVLFWWSRPAFDDSTASPGPADDQGRPQQSGSRFGTSSGASGRETAARPGVASRPLVTEARRSSPEARGGLEILVLSEHEGQPVMDAIVSVGPLASEEREQLVTDARGRALPVVAPGEYQVVVQADGYLTRNLRLGIPPTGAPVRREVLLPRVVTVDGIVLDQNGLAVEGASVNFSAGRQRGRSTPTRNTRTDEEGVFSIEVVPATYRVRASKSPHPRSEQRDVEVGEEGRAPLQIRMELRTDTVTLSGTVVDDKGSSVKGATIRLRYRSGGRRRTLANGRSGSDGTFEIELVPRGGLELTVQASGYETANRNNLSVRSDIELQLELSSYPSFAVRVVDQAGRPIDNARVHGVDHRNRSVLSRRPDGRYFTRAYPVRIYADALNRNLGVSTEILVESYQPQVDLVLQPGCTLKGRVVGDDGDPLNSFVVSVKPSGMGSLSRRIYAEDGSFELRDLPSGQATISVSATGFERFRNELTLEDVRASWLEVVLSPRQPRRTRDGGGISQGRGGRRQPGPGLVTPPGS